MKANFVDTMGSKNFEWAVLIFAHGGIHVHVCVNGDDWLWPLRQSTANCFPCTGRMVRP